MKSSISKLITKNVMCLTKLFQLALWWKPFKIYEQTKLLMIGCTRPEIWVATTYAEMWSAAVALISSFTCAWILAVNCYIWIDLGEHRACFLQASLEYAEQWSSDHPQKIQTDDQIKIRGFRIRIYTQSNLKHSFCALRTFIVVK